MFSVVISAAPVKVVKVLPHRLDILDTIQDEDYIEFGSVGAYGLATMTNFNGYGSNGIISVNLAYAL